MKKVLLLSGMFVSLATQAASYRLPDPGVSVIPDYSHTTTIITIAGVTYRGPSRFYYVSECAKRDGASYHCSVMSESGVLLTAEDGSGARATINLTAQFSSTLIRSGHNYWRQSQIVLNGEVKIHRIG